MIRDVRVMAGEWSISLRAIIWLSQDEHLRELARNSFEASFWKRMRKSSSWKWVDKK